MEAQTTNKEIVLYSRSAYIPFVALARDLLSRYQIPFREVNIDDQPQALARLQDLTGDVRLPTIIICKPGEDAPFEAPLVLTPEAAKRGTDRGSMIVEPNNHQLEDWLYKHKFLAKPYRR